MNKSVHIIIDKNPAQKINVIEGHEWRIRQRTWFLYIFPVWKLAMFTSSPEGACAIVAMTFEKTHKKIKIQIYL